MNVAIFYDAEAVAGDGELLRRAKQALIDAMHGERAHLARFARAVDAFPTPIGLFNNLVTHKDHGDALDLKKGGIFPIVHGVRALALETRPRRDRHRGAHRPARRRWARSATISRAN